MAEGIFIRILPQLELAALATVISQMKNILGKAGGDISASMAQSKREIVALQDASINAANRAAEARIKAARTAANAEIEETRRADNFKKATAKLAADRNADLTAAELLALNKINTANSQKALAAEQQAQADAKAVKATKDAAEAQAAMNSQVAMTGGAFGAMGGAAAAAFGVMAGASVAAATKMETGMARLQVAGQVPLDQMKAMHDGILNLSSSMGEPLDKLNEASLMLAKSGDQYKNAAANMMILKQAIELSKTEGADLTTTVQQMTTIMTDFSMSTDQAANVAAKLQIAASNAKRPLEEFLGAMHNIEPTAALMLDRVTGPDQLLGVMGQLAKQGAGMDQTTLNFNNLLQHLGNANSIQMGAFGLLGMDTNQMAEDLKKPNGLINVLDQLHDALSRVKSTGTGENTVLHFGDQAMLPQITKPGGVLDQELAALRPVDQAKAQNLIDAYRNNKDINKDDLRSLRSSSATDGKVKQFLTTWQKATGFNYLVQGGKDPNNVPLEQLFGNFAGSFTSERSLYGLIGNPTDQNDTHWADTKKGMAGVAGARPGADGNLPGWDTFKDTNKQKIDELKGSMDKLAVSIGEHLLPAAKIVVDVLNDFFKVLDYCKPVTTAVTDLLAIMTLRWIGLKAAMGFQGLLTAMATGFKGVAKEAEGASLSAAGIGTASGKAAKAGETAAVGMTSSLGKVGKEAENSVTKLGKIGDKLKFLGSMVWPVTIAMTINEIVNDGKSPVEKLNDDYMKYGGWHQLLGIGSTWLGLDHPAGVVTGGNSPADRRGTRGDGKDGFYPFDKDANGNPVSTPTDSSINSWNGAPGGPNSEVPTGDPSNPVTVTLPQAELDQIGKSNLGATPGAPIPGEEDTTYGKGASDFNNPLKELRKGGFSLSSIAEIMTKFLVNLALGNPIGHLAAGTSMFGGQPGADGAGDPAGVGAQAEIDRIQHMTKQQIKAEKNQDDVQKANDEYVRATRDYTEKFKKYGANDYRTKDAHDKMVEALDNQSTVVETQVSNLQSAGDMLIAAQQKVSYDLTKGYDKSDPSKYASDVAARDKALGQIPDGAKINGVEVHNAEDAAKVAAQASAAAAKSSADAAKSAYEAGKLAAQAAHPTGTGGTGTRNLPQGLMPGFGDSGGGPTMPGASVTYTPDWMVQHGFPALYQRDTGAGRAGNIPDQIQQLAAQFGLDVNSHTDSTLHGGLRGAGNTIDPMGGWGFDFYGKPGDPDGEAKMEALNKWAMSPQNIGNIAQLIHRGGGKDWGVAGGQDVSGPIGQASYYNSGQGYYDHGDHDHIAFARMPSFGSDGSNGYPAGYTDPSTWGVGNRGGGLSGGPGVVAPGQPWYGGGGAFGGGPNAATSILGNAASGTPLIPTVGRTPLGVPAAAAGGKGPGPAGVPHMGSGAPPGPPVPSNQATYTDPGTGSGGIGAGQGIQGTIMGMANSAAMAALSATPAGPAAGVAASMAMQIGEQELSNVANYVAKIAGVAVDGIFETFGVSDPDGGQTGPKGGQNWLTKVFGGLAGGHPQNQNSAGGTQPPVKPSDDKSADQQGQGDGNGGPNVTFNNTFHNATDPQANVTKMNQMMLTAPTAPS